MTTYLLESLLAGFKKFRLYFYNNFVITKVQIKNGNILHFFSSLFVILFFFSIEGARISYSAETLPRKLNVTFVQACEQEPPRFISLFFFFFSLNKITLTFYPVEETKV